MNSIPHLKYRPEIDGLRAIAVLSVIGFHAFPNQIPSGFVGVDIFFIISGFLISGLIYQALDEGRFSFRDFYARRVKRIFPGLLLVLVTCLVVGRYFLFDNEYVALSKHVVAGGAFFSNIALWQEAGYFDAASETKPLLHLWSLGIEEQFYIVWPILLVLIWKRISHIYWIIGLLLALSLGLNLIRVGVDPTATFYLPFTRFWELWIGSLLAYSVFLHGDIPQWLGRRCAALRGTEAIWTKCLREFSGGMGILLLVVSIFLLRKGAAFPGWRALLPTLGASLIILAGPTALLNRHVLSHPWVVFIGAISYPLYLWHWPLLSFLKIEYGFAPKEFRLAMLALSFVLAWLTYRLLERPIRFGKAASWKPIGLALAMVLVISFGGQRYLRGVDMQDSRNAFIHYYQTYDTSHHLGVNYRFECSLIDAKGQNNLSVPDDCSHSGLSKKVFIWGDSHAQQLAYGLKNNLGSDVALLQVATFGCAPSITENSLETSICDRSNRFAIERIRAIKPDVVVLAQAEFHEQTAWENIASMLHDAGVKNVVLVGPVPQWQPYLYRVVAREFWNNIPQRTNASLKSEVVKTEAILKERYANSATLTYVSVFDTMCNQKGCLVYLGDDPKTGLVSMDYGHLTLDASDYVVRNAFLPKILPLLQTP